MPDILAAAEALRARGFEAHCFDTAAQAASYLLKDMPAGQTVAIGGCMTARQMKLDEQLREAGHDVLWHWYVPHSACQGVLHEAMYAPLYVTSVNAMTTDGLMLNIDGTGNRVAAMCYGPDTVYVLVGRNKLVEGGYQQAVRRAKQIACPQNARRLNLDTPCATGPCDVSACKKPMCNVIVSLEHPPTGHRMCVVLIDEELGY